jgi:colanic acid biosynthesis protein WcaH
MYLSKEDFSVALNLLPLISIDFCILNHEKEMLFVERNCRPAQGFLFTPGGRIFKNESLANASKRISKEEIGFELGLDEMIFIGIYDHFYEDSAYDKNISTHYVNMPHLIHLDKKKTDSIKVKYGHNQQHGGFEWFKLEKAIDSKRIHDYSKIYAEYILKKTLNKL